MNVETKRWTKCHNLTWFTGKTIREATDKCFKWIKYMEEADYAIHPKSISYGDGILIVFYMFHDEVK